MKIIGPKPGELDLKSKLCLVYFTIFTILYTFNGDFLTQELWGWLPAALKWRLAFFLLDIGYWYWIAFMKWTAIPLLLITLYNNISIEIHDERREGGS